MIDKAVHNTLVLWLLKNLMWYEYKHGLRRRLFLHELGISLVLPQIIDGRNSRSLMLIKQRRPRLVL